MLKAIHCNLQNHSFGRATSLEQIHDKQNDPDTIFWLDLVSPSAEEMNEIAQTFHLHPLAVEDSTQEHQRPKIEDYQDFYFVVFYTIAFQHEEQLKVEEIDMFLGKNYLITVHETAIPIMNEVELRWTRNARQLEAGIGILFYSLLDTIVDSYFPVVDQMVDEVDELEESMFEGNVRQNNLTMSLLNLKKRFLAARRIITPERDVLNVLTNRDNPIFDDQVNIYFRDVYDHITRLSDTLDLYRDQISSTMDANLSIVSNDLNKVMRTLTATSIILMCDSLIAGIYGMNFENMPELHWTYGYFYVLAAMAVITALLVAFFKRMNWF